MEWVGEDNGLIFPVGDSLSLANSLNTYYKDRGLLKMHGEKNKQIVKSRADWDKNYSILKNIYGSLIR
jgi:glycosyltransferase involved in cell wall biosynthesis